MSLIPGDKIKLERLVADFEKGDYLSIFTSNILIYNY